MPSPYTIYPDPSEILLKKTAVSDSVNYTCAAGAVSCVDPDRGMLYMAYSASRHAYGEQRDVLALSVIPVAQPHAVRYRVVLEHDACVGTVRYDHPDVPGIAFVDGKVRVFFLSRHGKGRRDATFDPTAACYYREYDPATDRLSDVFPVLCAWDGQEAAPLSAERYLAFMKERGIEGTRGDVEAEELNMSAKIMAHHGVCYSVLTSVSTGYPVVWESADGGQTIRFRGVLPQRMRYECAVEMVQGKIYCLLRESPGANFYCSDDFGLTFTASQHVLPLANTRPRLVAYKERLLLCYSLLDVKPNLIRNGRNNLVVRCGQGLEADRYDDLLTLVDPFGILYFDIVNYKNVLYLMFSSGDLYTDRSQQGKDIIYYTKIGLVMLPGEET